MANLINNFWDADVSTDFIIEVTTTSSPEDFTLPLQNGGTYNLNVDWGDLDSDVITTWDQAEKTHSFATAGTYQISMNGDMGKWGFNNGGDKLLCTDIIQFGNLVFQDEAGLFYGCTNLQSTGSGAITITDTNFILENAYRDCTTITTVHSDLLDNIDVPSIGLRSIFEGCTSFTTIPSGFLDLQTSMTAMTSNWLGCTSLTTVPTDLLRFCTSLTSLPNTFQNCSSLTSLPDDFLRYNTSVTVFTLTFANCGFTSAPVHSGTGDGVFFYNPVTIFSQTFSGCSSMTSIASGYFDNNTAVTSFLLCFISSGLTSIPSGLFDNCTLVTSFGNTFRATAITTVPTDLFKLNTAVTTFESCFRSCAQLATLSVDLFRYNTVCLNFKETFRDSPKIQQHSTIFYASGGESTRFLNQTVNFSTCFFRLSFTGTQGTAPDLWNVDFGTGGSTKTNCWAGAGNSGTSLTNYASIPSAWGGPA